MAVTAQKVSPAQQNMAARQILLQTAQRNLKFLGTFGPFAAGGLMHQSLDNIGIYTGLWLQVTATISNTGGGGHTLTPSIKSPWNLLQNVSLLDYSGVKRINATGYQLWLNRVVRRGLLAGYSHPNITAQGLPAYTMPNVPTPAAGANSTAFEFWLYVPIAYDRHSDLRGAILAQSITGEMFLDITFNPNSPFGSDTDSVYNPDGGGAGTVTNINVAVFEEFLAPVPVQGQFILPLQDLGMIYSLDGALSTTSNLSAGLEKVINYPNFRSVLSLMVEWVNGGAMAAGDITQFRKIIGANSYPQVWTEHMKAAEFRNHFGFDLPPATYYFSDRMVPINTQLFGNVELGITPAAVSNGNTKMNVLVESFYPVGSPLTGVGAGS